MKKFLGIVLLLSVLASASFGDTYVWKGNAETKLLGVTAGSTMNMSDVTKWQFNGTFPNLPISSPWAGIVNADQTGGVYWQYTNEARMADQYGMTMNVDTDLGDGTLAGYRHGTSTTAVYNVLGKWSGKNGTVNMNGHTVYVDGLQMGTVARTAYGVVGGNAVVGQYTLNMDAGSKIVVLGSAQVGYTANGDTTLNMSGTAQLDVLTATKNLELGRSSAAGQKVNWNLNGSDLSINLDALKLNNYTSGTVGVDALQQKIKFVMDADGASAVKLNRASNAALAMGVDSRLRIELTAVPPATEIVLFDLTNASGAISGGNSGKFRNWWGTTLGEGSIMAAYYDGVLYGWRLSYKGGTGNDVTLTMVPEPATIGLLGLGGLVLARRRRA